MYLGVPVQLLALVINNATQRVGSTYAFGDKGARRRFDENHATTSHPFVPALINVRGDNVHELE